MNLKFTFFCQAKKSDPITEFEVLSLSYQLHYSVA